MNYILHILIMMSIYLILALSLNLIVGFTGLLSMCHAAFYGIGAYISTLLIMNAHIGFVPALALAVIGAMLLSLTISVPSLRLKGDYFVLAALGFQIIVFTILYNWIGLTRGPYGIPGIPRPAILGLEFGSLGLFLLLSAVIAAICIGLLHLIGNSPFGRVLKAIREDEMAAAALGKDIPRFKVVAFAIGAGFAAVSGSLFAGYMGYIDPTSFTLMESVFILSIIIIGGTGNIVGPLIGTVLMILLPEILRFVRMPDAIAANVRQIIYGLLIILIMRFRPRGLLGEYKFQ
ncbi:MAG: branched-chain amino acid ABC transporter permease [Candidatus Eisenbacteria bacterium]|nr:branched-chain amino acid ABC transporter permease [Candidatus Eisenbacteria bacterium]